MSSFKDELLKSVAPKVDITNSVHAKINTCIDELIAAHIEDGYKRLTEEILRKAKTTEYTEHGNSRSIKGYFHLPYEYAWQEYSATNFWTVAGVYPDPPGRIAEKYLSKFPDVSMSYYSDGDKYVFCCILVNRVKHSTFFGSDYHTYHCTDTAKRIIAGIRRKAAADNIQVEFSHIGFFDTWNHCYLEIDDGGNDKQRKRGWNSDARFVLKYSVTF